MGGHPEEYGSISPEEFHIFLLYSFRNSHFLYPTNGVGDGEGDGEGDNLNEIAHYLRMLTLCKQQMLAKRQCISAIFNS